LTERSVASVSGGDLVIYNTEVKVAPAAFALCPTAPRSEVRQQPYADCANVHLARPDAAMVERLFRELYGFRARRMQSKGAFSAVAVHAGRICPTCTRQN
jgi:hypothetical protein